jgi:hypothetical protein
MEAAASPSERELSLMRLTAEANAKNLRAEKMSVAFVGGVTGVGGIVL